MLVTLAGYDIMKGRALLKRTEAGDFAHVILACLFHDIGYVRGILEGDDSDGYVIDAKGGKTSLPRGSSDAALTPHHVDRSKLFVMDRLGGSNLRVARADHPANGSAALILWTVKPADLHCRTARLLALVASTL